MDIKIGKINLISSFKLDKFNLPFYCGLNEYEVTVYFKDQTVQELEDSVLYGKYFSGEYILNGVKLLFSVVIYVEKYNTLDEYIPCFAISDYKNI